MSEKRPRISTRTPRTGRRPGASSTREDILDAARRLFSERGYQGATMRAIAAEAGVDAALVVHFFGNKATLLAEAVEWPFDPEVEMPKLLVDGRHHVGRHLVGLFVRTWDDEGSRNPILTLLRAATIEPQAAAMLREFMGGLYAPLMDRLQVDQPELRADLAVSQLLGLGLVRYLLRAEPLASATPEAVVDWIAPTVQRYLTGKLDR
jgi:AcrR family transcriptional regulator